MYLRIVESTFGLSPLEWRLTTFEAKRNGSMMLSESLVTSSCRLPTTRGTAAAFTNRLLRGARHVAKVVQRNTR